MSRKIDSPARLTAQAPCHSSEKGLAPASRPGPNEAKNHLRIVVVRFWGWLDLENLVSLLACSLHARIGRLLQSCITELAGAARFPAVLSQQHALIACGPCSWVMNLMGAGSFKDVVVTPALNFNGNSSSCRRAHSSGAASPQRQTNHGKIHAGTKLNARSSTATWRPLHALLLQRHTPRMP